MMPTISFIVMMNLLFFMSTNILHMSIILLAQALLISIMSALMIKMTWTSYALVVVFMSAVMMVFLYFSSLSSNMLNLNQMLPKMLLTSSMFALSWLTLLALNPLTTKFNNLTKMTNLNMTAIYSSEFFYLTVSAMMLLFIALILVNMITNNCKKPLRTY